MSKHDKLIVEEVKRLREENDRLRRKIKEYEEMEEEDRNKDREFRETYGLWPYDK